MLTGLAYYSGESLVRSRAALGIRLIVELIFRKVPDTRIFLNSPDPDSLRKLSCGAGHAKIYMCKWLARN